MPSIMPMQSIFDAFPSKYLKAGDLGDKHVTVAISHITTEDMGDNEEKPVVYFVGKTKGLVLNRVNATKIVEIAGTEDFSQWEGLQICLFATTTEFKGKTVPAIRIEVPTRAKKPAPKPPVEDDEQPF
jgi:hypothetical protein